MKGKLITISVVLLAALAIIAVAEANGGYYLNVDGTVYSPSQISGPVRHYETPDTNPGAAFSDRHSWAGNGSDNLPCPNGIHWIDNDNVLTISHCLPGDEPTPTPTNTPEDPTPTPTDTPADEETPTPTSTPEDEFTPTPTPTEKSCKGKVLGALFHLIGPEGQECLLASYQRNPNTGNWAIPNVQAQEKCCGFVAVNAPKADLIEIDCDGIVNIICRRCVGGGPAEAYGEK